MTTAGTRQQPIPTRIHSDATATEVLGDVDLSGTTAVVTGGYSGIGLETTRALHAAGARVLVPARRLREARAALSDLERVEVAEMDLADLASVRSFATAVVERLESVDILVGSAGIMAAPERRVGPRWESHLAINHLGHFALVAGLRPALARRGARVVVVSSGGHALSGIRWDDPQFDSDYDRWLAYGQSKTANALFALELDRRGEDDGIQAFSVHPGSILTPLQRHLTREEKIGLGWIDADGRPAAGFKTTEQGAATSVWAATATSLADRGGEYLEDCDIAPLSEEDGAPGVKPWAVDPAEAVRLWEMSAGVC